MATEKTTKQPVKTNEQRLNDKKSAFKRIVTPRVNRAVKAIKLVGNCAGSNYMFSPEQAKAIIMALDVAVRHVESLYSKKSDKAESFTL